jgi:hypothetical protein
MHACMHVLCTYVCRCDGSLKNSNKKSDCTLNARHVGIQQEHVSFQDVLVANTLTAAVNTQRTIDTLYVTRDHDPSPVASHSSGGQ